MPSLREAATQALEALKLCIPKPRSTDDDYAEQGWKEHNAAITALRAALAEPVQEEPVAWGVFEGENLHDFYSLREDAEKMAGYKGSHATVLPLYTTPTQRKPVAKVELMTTGGNAGLATRIVEIDDHLRERLRPGQLLYTTPPQRQPLTDEEIQDCFHAARNAKLGSVVVEIARAIERAHGIGGQDE